MKRLVAVLVLAALVLVASGSIAASDQTPQQQITQLKNKLRNARLTNADLQDEIDAQDALISDQSDQIQRLQNRLQNQPDPLDVITARGPDGLWNAMGAIWRAFPTLGEGQLCGYDKAVNPGGGVGLTLTSFTFYRWQGC